MLSVSAEGAADLMKDNVILNKLEADVFKKGAAVKKLDQKVEKPVVKAVEKPVESPIEKPEE